MTAELAFGEQLWSGAQIDQRAQLAAGGLADLGVKEGDVIAVMLRNDPVYLDLIQACRIAGCYFCPINWHFKSGEVEYLLRDSSSKVLFVHADLYPGIAQALPAGLKVILVPPHADVVQSYQLASGPDAADSGHEDFAEWLARQTSYSGPVRTPRGHMAYTSGTTGNPKGIRRFPPAPERQAEQLAAAQAVVRDAFGIYPGVRSLISAPLYHSAPSLFVQQSMLQAERLVVAPKFDAEETLALIERHRIQTAYLVPVMYVRMLRLPPEVRARYDLSSLRFVASTGSPCAPDIKRGMIEWLGPVINETYASSESGLVTAIDGVTSLAKPGSVGRPVGNAVIAIFDGEGQRCKQGDVGTIYVRQPAYPDFTYNNNDAARAAIERDGMINVGDMGYLDQEGFLYICDRASDMVISGGVNIYPAEIEHALINLAGIADCAVFGIPDEEYGEALCAAIMIEPAAGLTPELIKHYLKQHIADYKVPRRIDIVAALPRDDNGKVAKRKLRDAYWAGRERRI